MGKINKANLKKTIYYLKRNGLKNTCYAALERMEEPNSAAYSYVPVSEEERKRQREWSADKKLSFSIVVPAYRTNEVYLREMIESVEAQTYPHWELILADATEDDSVKNALDKITHDTQRVRYIRLTENAGIAANTNQALRYATGEYIGLLDHDDVLTDDALYEMAVCIENRKNRGMELQMLYSDEDKCNGDRTRYYEPNRKEKFNFDLILSNNYICHFLVMKSELIKSLGFRKEYDGAQDYDLVLRTVGVLTQKAQTTDLLLCPEQQIAHIPKVLYHWRCHTGSTAENPRSKQYAYDAGVRALQDFSNQMGYGAEAVALKHLGFFALKYSENPLKIRRELGAVGGSVLEKAFVPGGKKITGGRMSAQGTVFYKDLSAVFGGYMHRAVLTQNAEAVDIRCIQVREECRELFEQIVGVPYQEIPCRESKGFFTKESEKIKYDLIFDTSTLPANADYRELSLKFCRALREAGYGILYQPTLTVTVVPDRNRKGEQH